MFTVNEVAARLGVTPATVEFHIYRRGDLQTVKQKRVGQHGCTVLVTEAELERFVSARAEVAGLLNVQELAEQAGVDRSVMQRRLNGVAPAKVIGRKKFYNPDSLVVTSKSV